MLTLSHRSPTGPAVRGIAMWARRVRTRLNAYRLEQREQARVIAELSNSSDRELGELGYSRADLIAIARGTYER